MSRANARLTPKGRSIRSSAISRLASLEVVPLGDLRSYPSFVRGVRRHGLRPHCESCAGVRGRATIEISHPPGDEIQWDWLERRRAPWGGTAHVLLGTLPRSGRVRGVISTSEDQAHLIEALDGVLRRLGGTTPAWRTDRLTTVIVRGTGDVQASFAPVAKHYGAIIRPCPPRRGNRKGSVEAAVRYACGRWWRTMPAQTMTEAQVSLDRFCERIGDVRRRGQATVGELATAEPLLPLPSVPYPATIKPCASCRIGQATEESRARRSNLRRRRGSTSWCLGECVVRLSSPGHGRLEVSSGACPCPYGAIAIDWIGIGSHAAERSSEGTGSSPVFRTPCPGRHPWH